jgi:hypothetical protein
MAGVPGEARGQAIWNALVQYKVGLNTRAITMRLTNVNNLGVPIMPTSGVIAHAWHAGHACVPIDNAMDDCSDCIGIAPALGLHRMHPQDIQLIVWNSRKVIGLVHDKTLLVDETATSLIPQGIHAEYESTERLGAILRSRQKVTTVHAPSSAAFEEGEDDDLDDGDRD